MKIMYTKSRVSIFSLKEKQISDVLHLVRRLARRKDEGGDKRSQSPKERWAAQWHHRLTHRAQTSFVPTRCDNLFACWWALNPSNPHWNENILVMRQNLLSATKQTDPKTLSSAALLTKCVEKNGTSRAGLVPHTADSNFHLAPEKSSENYSKISVFTHHWSTTASITCS